MSILFRYVFREYLIPFVYCMIGFHGIYLLFDLFGCFAKFGDRKPPFDRLCLYFAGYLSPYVEWIVPACLMLAALYTMWSFCRHSELTAMRASGIGFFTIVKPVLTLAAVMAVCVAAVNEFYVPRHAQWAKYFKASHFDETEMKIADNIVYRHMGADRTWNIGAAIDPAATALEDVTVSQDYPNGARRFSLKAPRARYLDGEWWFKDATVLHYAPDGTEIPSPVPERDALRLRCFPEFDEKPVDFILQNRETAYFSIADRIRFMRTHPNMAPESKRRMTYDLWQAVAAPLACLVITLFAVPAGIATGRQSVFRGILVALGMFFGYYAAVIGGMVLAYSGVLPGIVAGFLPPVAFTVAGVVMFNRQR